MANALLTVDEVVASISEIAERKCQERVSKVAGVVSAMLNVDLTDKDPDLPIVVHGTSSKGIKSRFANTIYLHFIGGVKGLGGLDYYCIHIRLDAGEVAEMYTDTALRSKGVPFDRVSHPNGATSFVWVQERGSGVMAEHKNAVNYCQAGYNAVVKSSDADIGNKSIIPFAIMFRATYPEIGPK